MSRLAHLVTRYFASVRARPLDDATVAWAAAALEPAELRVWNEMSRADRAEGADVARRLEVALAGTSEAADPRWVAAALVHDAGKQAAGYGTIGRVMVTVAAAALGPVRLRRWAGDPKGAGADRASLRARMGSYIAHDDLGAVLLEQAGARPEVAAWAGAHHRPERWSGSGIPDPVCRALAAADGEPEPARPA